MDLAITLDQTLALPLHQQLYEALRQAILTGQLPAGQRLPSTRVLAQSLHVARGTVKLGYEQLLNEGYVETIRGSGTFVCQDVCQDLTQQQQPQSPAAITPDRAVPPPLSLSRYARSLVIPPPTPPQPSPEIDFCYWRPALDQVPLDRWRRLTVRQLQALATTNLDYNTDGLGYRPLREAIAQYLARSRAVRCTPNQVMITNGTQQAVDLIARLLLEPGTAIALEEPGYLSARRIFQSQGAKLIPIPVDADGLQVSALRSPSQAQPKLVYVTPSHQFPTGSILPLPRRLELLAWAKQTGALIIEDDYDSEYRYGERPIPALQGLDPHQVVLYIGTFSKVLFPALRIGYLVLPPSLVSVFVEAKRLSDRHQPTVDQAVLAEFIQQGYLERHLRRMRNLYTQRRQVLVNALQTHLGDRIKIFGDSAGIHLLIEIDTSLSEQELLEQATARGLRLTGCSDFYLHKPVCKRFLLGYANLEPTQIEAGVQRLAEVLMIHPMHDA
ncbi:MAG: PLP-dependent aminotransferase family protein [Cyanobacteria bacterium P01_H01_bin.121]